METLFYALLAVELIGLVFVIIENVVKTVFMRKSSESLKHSSPTFERKTSVLCQRFSSNIMLFLNQMNSEAVEISELKKLMPSEVCDIIEKY